MAARKGSSPKRRSPPRPPVCRYTFDGRSCRKRGEHFCTMRADRAQAFIEEICVHTKSVYARRPFILEPWQRDDIVRPLFGTVRWDAEWQRYLRRYTVAWIELGRGNGKSELAASIVLFLLVGDDEESAEVYGAATDTKQAGKVGEVVKRMMELSPLLRRRLKYNKQSRRIIDPRTNSYYEVIPGDAAGELGHNPYGAVIDEFLTQGNPDLYTALRTAQGKRPWSLLLCFTTAGDDPAGFAAQQHNQMVRISEQPDKAPHVFTYLRNTPDDADPWDERNWHFANPGLGRFLSIQTLREEADEAKEDPGKENGFRQFRLNQWMRQVSRWMPMHRYNDPDTVGELWLSPDWGLKALAGRECWAGLDLSAKFDLTAWCLLFPPAEPGGPVDVTWRFWLPEDALPHLDRHHDGRWTRWAREGWLTVTDGNIVDYDRVYADIGADGEAFAIRGVDCDEWSMWPVIRTVADKCGLAVEGDSPEITAYKNTYDRMTPGMTEVMGLVKNRRFHHHGNPVAEYCFEVVEVRKAPYNPELIRPDKPERDKSGTRIDAVPTAAMAAAAWSSRGQVARRRSAYEDRGIEIA